LYYERGSFFCAHIPKGTKKCAKFPALAESLQKVHVFVVVVVGAATSQPTNNNNIQSNQICLNFCICVQQQRLGLLLLPVCLFVCLFGEGLMDKP
jgi:hypothetical protein